MPKKIDLSSLSTISVPSPTKYFKQKVEQHYFHTLRQQRTTPMCCRLYITYMLELVFSLQISYPSKPLRPHSSFLE